MKDADAEHAHLVEDTCLLVSEAFEGHSRLLAGDVTTGTTRLLSRDDVRTFVTVHGRLFALTDAATIVAVRRAEHGSWAAESVARLPGGVMAYGLDAGGSLVAMARGSDDGEAEARVWPGRVPPPPLPPGSGRQMFVLRLDDATGQLVELR
jgi:hypothetical protein